MTKQEEQLDLMTHAQQVRTEVESWPEWKQREARHFGFDVSDGAVIEGEYRYLLWRGLGSGGPAGRILWVMLNPSTATAKENDPTVRKVIGFSRRWGYAEARIVNLFALRSTDPKALRTHPAPLGPRNDATLTEECQRADAIILAWGGNADRKGSAVRDRALVVWRSIVEHPEFEISGTPLWHLGLTKGGMPKHPLMLGYDTMRKEAHGDMPKE